MNDPHRVPTLELQKPIIEYRISFGGFSSFFIVVFWAWHVLLILFFMLSFLGTLSGASLSEAAILAVIIAVKGVLEIWAYGAVVFGSMVVLSGMGFRRSD